MAFIIKPLVTEKMTKITDKSSVEKTYKVKGETRTKKAEAKYGFIVRPEAGKLEIKKEIESLYNVTVINVNTLRYAGKRSSRYTKAGTTCHHGDGEQAARATAHTIQQLRRRIRPAGLSAVYSPCVVYCVCALCRSNGQTVQSEMVSLSSFKKLLCMLK